MVSSDLAAIAVLLADLERARHGLDDPFSLIDAELHAAGGAPEPPSDPRGLAYVAILLSHYYNALEDLLERAARVFEGPPSGETGHTELLRRAPVTEALASLHPTLGESLTDFRRFLEAILEPPE